MQNLIKSIGILSIIFVCLYLMVVPSMAVETKDKTSCTGVSYQNYPPFGTYRGYPPTGFQGYDWSRYPGSTEFGIRWIPGHWVPVRVMVPGRVVYRPVWVPGYPITRYQWVPGFWQTMPYHSRPDVYAWGPQPGGWYGIPSQNYQPAQDGYFNAYGVWIPTRKTQK